MADQLHLHHLPSAAKHGALQGWLLTWSFSAAALFKRSDFKQILTFSFVLSLSHSPRRFTDSVMGCMKRKVSRSTATNKPLRHLPGSATHKADFHHGQTSSKPVQKATLVSVPHELVLLVTFCTLSVSSSRSHLQPPKLSFYPRQLQHFVALGAVFFTKQEFETRKEVHSNVRVFLILSSCFLKLFASVAAPLSSRKHRRS